MIIVLQRLCKKFDNFVEILKLNPNEWNNVILEILVPFLRLKKSINDQFNWDSDFVYEHWNLIFIIYHHLLSFDNEKKILNDFFWISEIYERINSDVWIELSIDNLYWDRLK